jgi:dipeptidyl aminopeptidase/acylaminoacyl peptidase
MIAHYRVTASLGSGGMGEVYRATDTKLGRDVAIKVLPAEVAADPDRLARFHREAQLVAALNHPHVAAIHGLEEFDGKPFLVLELVEGEDLSERLKRGPIPVDEAMRIAKQIAEALEEAHEKGIVHRDLKPGNIKVTPDGQVKVLDFGLAKVYSADPASGSAGDRSQSPTLGHAGTAAGLVLGTAAYMSPEQARGRAVDKRTDIWAFGVVLFEMLTGKRLFDAETVSDVLAAVLTRQVDWSALPKGTPPGVRLLLRRCLDRDCKNRLRDIGEARVLAAPGEPAAPPAEWPGFRVRGRSRWAAVLGGLLLTLAGVVVGRVASRTERIRAQPLARFALDTGQPLLSSSWHQFGGLAVSRDGQRLAWVASDGTVERLYQRTMDSLEERALPETAGASSPFFSPDGRWIGFFADHMLKKISVEGGAPVALAPVRDHRGGCWADGDELVFTPNSFGGLQRIPASGGRPTALTELDASRGEMSHRWPSAVAGANAVLFTVKTEGLRSFDDAPIAAVSLKNGKPKRVLDGGTGASYSSSGHLIYARAGALLAAPFDPVRLAVTGAPFTAVEGVSRSRSTGSAHYALSRSGTLLSLPGSVDVDNRMLVRVDVQGRVERLTRETRPFITVRTSPDGRRLALWIGTADDEVWIHEIERGVLTRLVPGAANQVWSPDGEWIVFGNTRAYGLSRVRADGSGGPEALLARKHGQRPTSISPDGKLLAFTEDSPETGSDVWTLSLDARETQLVLGGRFNESAAVFSPGGRLLAYVSDETGHDEVYVQPFPGPGAKRQVSVGGGTSPVWGRNDGEIFYQRGTDIMGVSVRTGASLLPSPPRKVAGGVVAKTTDDVIASWDLGPGGQGFVMPRQLEQKQASTLMLALNWAPDGARKAGPLD